jgi:hypothetical protein
MQLPASVSFLESSWKFVNCTGSFSSCKKRPLPAKLSLTLVRVATLMSTYQPVAFYLPALLWDSSKSRIRRGERKGISMDDSCMICYASGSKAEAEVAAYRCGGEELRSMYNPNITGYSNSDGPFLISLVEAKALYGELPSSYRLLSPVKPADGDADERDPNRVLNLDLGISLQTWLSGDKRRNLKPFVIDFFTSWHRDYETEFGISVVPLQNLNDRHQVESVIRMNGGTLEELSTFDTTETLLQHGIFKKDTLNSIPSDQVILKGIEAIGRKIASGSKSPSLDGLLSQLKARQVLDRLPFTDSKRYPLNQYADEIANALAEMSRFVDLTGCNSLRYGSDKGVEFAYAARDLSYLQLGRLFGDCTSDKRYLQTNCQTENIYWTVFSWILDCNYQILVAFIDGKPAIKCHILPLFVDVPQTEQGTYPCLFVDAIETTSQFKMEGRSAPEEATARFAYAFDCLIREVLAIADRMGISSVYSERFSNTAWVRQELEKLPEIYLDTRRIVKVDELEDVFGCASAFCSANGFTPPDAVFMEVQARNTYLISESIIGSNKSFGVVRGDPSKGLPAKYAFGV